MIFIKERRANNQASVVLPVIIKVVVKEVNINSKVLYISGFRTTKSYTTSKAIGKGIVIYRYNYILSYFN